MAYGELPFGARNAAVYKLTAEPSTYASKVDVPRIETVELTEEEDSVEMNASDVQVAVHTSATRLTGSMQYGGINLDTMVILNGGAAATTGTTPNLVTTFIRRGNQTKSYFKLEAQLYADDAGDDHLRAYKVKAVSGPTLGANQGEFLSTNVNLAGVFTADSPGKLYDVIANESVVAIS